MFKSIENIFDEMKLLKNKCVHTPLHLVCEIPVLGSPLSDSGRCLSLDLEDPVQITNDTYINTLN